MTGYVWTSGYGRRGSIKPAPSRPGPYEHQILVRALSGRRGPASEAIQLYEERPESRAAREAMALQLKSLHAAFVPERGRPTKKDRREINKLKGRER